jgi:uncharacterized membrane protein
MSKGEKVRKRPSGMRRLVTLVAFALAVAAIVKELRTPQAERTWNGKVAGFVPYDFRIPTLARIKDRFWNPEAEHVVSPRVFGVGWTLNMGRAVAVARRAVSH